MAEAQRLANLVEQEAIKDELEEKEEQLHILKFEADTAKSEAVKVGLRQILPRVRLSR